MTDKSKMLSMLMGAALTAPCLTTAAYAAPVVSITQQSGQCQGVVVDAQGEPIVGASVVVSGGGGALVVRLRTWMAASPLVALIRAKRSE